MQIKSMIMERMSEILDDAALAELLASSNVHGEYDIALKKFIESGEKGIKVSLTQGPFANKKPGSVKSGFLNAVNRAGSRKADGSYKADPLPEGVVIAVIQKDDNVHVIRRDLVVPGTVQRPTPAVEGAEVEGS